MAKRKPQPKTLQEWLEAPMSDFKRMLVFVTALDQHAFNIQVNSRAWKIFRFTLYDEVGTLASHDLEPAGDGTLTSTFCAWAGELNRKQVRELLLTAKD